MVLAMATQRFLMSEDLGAFTALVGRAGHRYIYITTRVNARATRTGVRPREEHFVLIRTIFFPLYTTYSTYTMYRLLYHIATAANSGIKIKAIGSWQRKRTKKKDEKQGRKKLIIQYVIIFMLRTFSSKQIYLYRNTSRYTIFASLPSRRASGVFGTIRSKLA